MFQSEFNDTSYVILRRDELGAVSYLNEGITYEIQVRLSNLEYTVMYVCPWACLFIIYNNIIDKDLIENS